MHAKGAGAFGVFTVTHDITKYTKAKIFSEIGKETPMFARFSTVAGERGAADAERDIRGFAMKFYTEQGNWASWATILRSSSFAIRSSFRISTTPSNGIQGPACGARKTTGTSGQISLRRCTRSPSP